MIKLFAKADPKYKGIVSGAGQLAYLVCDGNSKELIRQAEKNNFISLKGDEKDPPRKTLNQGIIGSMASVTPTDVIRMEFEVLSQIISCKGNVGETPAEYTNRFNGALASYVNLKSTLNTGTSFRFTVMMLRNANMSPDTLNARTN